MERDIRGRFVNGHKAFINKWTDERIKRYKYLLFKKDNNPENLISLCNNCHAQTIFHQEDWVSYFQQKMVENGNI